VGRPEHGFIEADQSPSFHLNAVIMEPEDEDLQGFLLNEKKIAEVVKPINDLSANGIDGISYRVIKWQERKE
jgi:hypothetical protein